MEPTKKILIVEDDCLVAHYTKKTIESLGYYIAEIVSSGEKAIKEVETKPFDLILMDIMLQGHIDGIEAAKQINASHNISNLKILSVF